MANDNDKRFTTLQKMSKMVNSKTLAKVEDGEASVQDFLQQTNKRFQAVRRCSRHRANIKQA